MHANVDETLLNELSVDRIDFIDEINDARDQKIMMERENANIRQYAQTRITWLLRSNFAFMLLFVASLVMVAAAAENPFGAVMWLFVACMVLLAFNLAMLVYFVKNKPVEVENA